MKGSAPGSHPAEEPTAPRDREIDDELAFHLDALIEQHLSRGLSREAAEKAAHEQFGSVKSISLAARKERGLPFFHWLVLDFKVLSRTRGQRRWLYIFASIFAVLVGFAAAAMTALHSLHQLLNQYPRSDRLVWISEKTKQLDAISIPLPDLLDWQRDTHSFRAIGVYKAASFKLTRKNSSLQRVDGLYTSSGFLEALSVTLTRGKNFNARDDDFNSEPAVIISDHLWKELKHEDTIDFERTKLLLDGRWHRIAGVLPSDFCFPAAAELLVSLSGLPPGYNDRGYHSGFWGVGRLKDDISLSAALADLAGSTDETIKKLLRRPPDDHPNLETFSQHFSGPIRRGLWIALIAGEIAAILLVALLFSIRIRRVGLDLAEQIIFEQPWNFERRAAVAALKLLVFIAAFAYINNGIGFILIHSIIGQNLIEGDPFALHLQSLLLAALIPLVAGPFLRLIWACNPLNWEWISWLSPFSPRVKLQSQSLRQYLLIASVALSFSLLLWAETASLNYHQSSVRDLGYSDASLISIRLDLTGTLSDDAQAREYGTLISKLKMEDNISALSVASRVPGDPTDEWQSNYISSATHEPARIELSSIGENYFKTLSIPVLRGREFRDTDSRAGSDEIDPILRWIHGLGKVVIDETLAQREWPSENPLGKKLILDWGRYHPSVEVIGVVRHIVLDRKETSVELPQVYFSALEAPRRGMALLIKSTSSATEVTKKVTQALQLIDSTGSVYEAGYVHDKPKNSLRIAAFDTWILAITAGLGWFLIGLYQLRSLQNQARVEAPRDDVSPPHEENSSSQLYQMAQTHLWGMPLGAAVFLMTRKSAEMSFNDLGSIQNGVVLVLGTLMALCVPVGCWALYSRRSHRR